MAMTPERIAEIEGLIPICAQDGVYLHLSPMEATELIRLARLGLRVEAARKCIARGYEDVRRLAVAEGRNKLMGKRVALVVLDDPTFQVAEPASPSP